MSEIDEREHRYDSAMRKHFAFLEVIALSDYITLHHAFYARQQILMILWSDKLWDFANFIIVD